MITIPLKVIYLEKDSFHLSILVEINTKKGEMIVDTGASKTVIDKQIVKDISLEPVEQRNTISSGLGGQINLNLVKLPKLKISDICIPYFTVALIDLKNINNLYQQYHHRKILGLLGSDFFLKYKGIIDYDKKQLSFHTNDSK